MNRQRRKSPQGGIEAQHRVRQTIRRDHFAVLANDQIVEAVLRRTLRLESSQQFSRGIKMQQFRSPAVGEGTGPYRVIDGANSDAQNRQESKTVCRNEIGNVAVSANLYNLPSIEAAQ